MKLKGFIKWFNRKKAAAVRVDSEWDELIKELGEYKKEIEAYALDPYFKGFCMGVVEQCITMTKEHMARCRAGELEGR